MQNRTKRPCIFRCGRTTCKDDICTICRRGLGRWEGREYDEIITRERHLEVLSARMHRVARSSKPRVKRARTRVVARHEARA